MHVILTATRWSRRMIAPVTDAHFAGEVDLSNVKCIERGRNGIPSSPSECCWQLCCSGMADLSDFYLAANLFSQTTLGHLWEPSVPGLWYRFIHLAKGLLKSFGYNCHFCRFRLFLHNYKNKHAELKSGEFFLIFLMGRSKTLCLFW